MEFEYPAPSKLNETRIINCPNCMAQLLMVDRLEKTQRRVILLGFAIAILFLIGQPVLKQNIWLLGPVAVLIVVHKIIDRWQRTHPRLRVLILGTPEKPSVP